MKKILITFLCCFIAAMPGFTEQGGFTPGGRSGLYNRQDNYVDNIITINAGALKARWGYGSIRLYGLSFNHFFSGRLFSAHYGLEIWSAGDIALLNQIVAIFLHPAKPGGFDPYIGIGSSMMRENYYDYDDEDDYYYDSEQYRIVLDIPFFAGVNLWVSKSAGINLQYSLYLADATLYSLKAGFFIGF